MPEVELVVDDEFYCMVLWCRVVDVDVCSIGDDVEVYMDGQ